MALFRMPDGSLININILPSARTGPGIHKFKKEKRRVEDFVKLDGEDLVKFGSITDKMRLFLEVAVKARLNIIIAGNTSSGKTTTLNILSNFIPQDERVVTIEDAAELQIRILNLVSLELRPANIEGEVTIRDLVKNALLMRPERIIVGECRSGETLDVLQAMNNGHDGSMSTVYANSPRDTILRLETLCLMSGLDLPIRAIREQLALALDVIVHQERMRDGKRKIMAIAEVQGMEGDTILLQDLFGFEQKGRDATGKVIGRHRCTGFRPQCANALEAAGYALPRDFFMPD